jgi:hypothetical protein
MLPLFAHATAKFPKLSIAIVGNEAPEVDKAVADDHIPVKVFVATETVVPPNHITVALPFASMTTDGEVDPEFDKIVIEDHTPLTCLLLDFMKPFSIHTATKFPLGSITIFGLELASVGVESVYGEDQLKIDDILYI